jgi:hypothetical protein
MTAPDPFGERTVTVSAAIDDVDQQLDDLADRMVEADGGTAAAQTITQLVSDAEKSLQGLVWLRGEYAADAEITVRGLSAGDQARVEDRASDIRAERSGAGNAPGSRRQVTVATGLVDAPFLDAGAGYKETLRTVADLPDGVVVWLQSEIDDATSLEGNEYRRFGERLQARLEE